MPGGCCFNLPSVTAQQHGIIRALAGRLGMDLFVSGSVWPPAAAGAFPCNEFIFPMVLYSMSNADVNAAEGCQ